MIIAKEDKIHNIELNGSKTKQVDSFKYKNETQTNKKQE